MALAIAAVQGAFMKLYRFVVWIKIIAGFKD